MSLLRAFWHRLTAKAVIASYLPDAALTPGVINPDVTQANIATTIGKRGWTATIRPPVAYTDALKKTQMRERGLPGKPSDYEEDHLISLELGGHPTDPRNLWPEPYKVANGWNAAKKDKLENYLNKLVCKGTISLETAQSAISDDWTQAYSRYMK